MPATAPAQQLRLTRPQVPPTAMVIRNDYLSNEVMHWSAEKIIFEIYNTFLVSCRQRNHQRMNRALVALMSALNFEHPDPATRLYRLYEYCQELVSKNKFDEASSLITDLRDSWGRAFHLG
jgi:flagellin-specific chaperone FliS